MKRFDQINVIPFIDIMLVLLAIVLMTATFISQGKIKVSVPKVSENQAVSQEDMKQLITIDEQGQFYFDDQQVELDELEVHISKLVKDSKISLKVDANSVFQDFVSVTDILNKYELSNVSVITEKLNSAE